MHTWDQAVAEWQRTNVFRTPAWQYGEASLLRWLRPHLAGVALAEIGLVKVQAIRAAKIAQGVTAYTVNAHLAVIRAVLRAAVDWGWLERAPLIKMLRRPPAAASVRHITPAQARLLLSLLPRHTRENAAFERHATAGAATARRLEHGADGE